MRRFLLIALASLAVSAPAFAIIYGGNPNVKIAVGVDDIPGIDGILIEDLTLIRCSASDLDFVIDAEVDPGEDWASSVDPGLVCGVTITWSQL